MGLSTLFGGLHRMAQRPKLLLSLGALLCVAVLHQFSAMSEAYRSVASSLTAGRHSDPTTSSELWLCVDPPYVSNPREVRNIDAPSLSSSCGTHAQPVAKQETEDTSYVQYQARTNRYRFLRPAEERGRNTSPGIQFTCQCVAPCHRFEGVSRFCPDGIACRNRFPQLDGYSSIDEAISHPFGSRLMLSRNTVKAGDVVDYRDAVLNPQTAVLTPTFIEALSFAPSGQSRFLHRQCAVVGHSGILINSSYGRNIDSYDAVFRMNENPWEIRPRDVGSRTDYWLFSGQYTLDMLKSSGMLWRIKQNNATIVYLWNMARDMARIEDIAKADPSLKIVALHPGYWMWFANRRIDLYPAAAPNTWEWKVLHEERTSMSGTITINVALHVCEHVDIYGFYGFVHNPEGTHIPYHWACPSSPRAQLAGRLDYELLLMLASLDPPERRRLRLIL